MYEDSDLFDPNAMIVQSTLAAAAAATNPTSDNCFSQMGSSESVMTATVTTQTQNNTISENVGLSVETLPYPYPCGENQASIIAATTTAMEVIGHSQQMELDMEIPYNNNGNVSNNIHLAEEANNNNSNDSSNNNSHAYSYELSFDQSNWDTIDTTNCVPRMHQFPYPTQTPDLLNLLHMPTRSPNSSLANSSISFENPTTQNNTNNTSLHGNNWVGNGNYPMGAESTYVSTVSCDPLLHLNLQAPMFHQSLPHGCNTMMMTQPPTSRSDFVFGIGDDYDNIEGSGVVAYLDGDLGRDFDNNNGVLEFTQDVAYVGKKRGGKRTKQVTTTTERQRRVDLSGKFDALKDLIPNPSKNDRASVVGDAINYIRELLRTVNELTLLVEKKRYEKQRVKRHKVNEEGDLLEGCNDDLNKQQVGDQDEEHSFIESLRSSWIQRKSKDTEVDVRIIDNEVTIKLVQRKRIINACLVHASQALHELNLDLQHVAGGHIGDFYSFMFNSKICEGSSVYASAIADKLIEVMDRSLAAV